MSGFVYADNAATTALSETAFNAMLPYLKEHYGNPSSLYSFARTARRALEDARATTAAAIGALPEEIYFTGGGTEADNWALKGAAQMLSGKGKHIISSKIEHHAVLHSLEHLKKQGFEITYLDVDGFGRVDPDSLRAAIRPDTILVSIMAANNEIGTVEPIAQLGAIAREKGVLFHTDAVQAMGHIPIRVKDMNIDLLSMAGHKFRGPKGVGALYVRKGVKLPPLIHGGGQERGERSGTENVAGIAGMAAALGDAVKNMDENTCRITAMRDRLIEGVLRIPYSRLTGDPVNRLPGTASFAIEYIEGESMILLLDAAGICASSGSACSTGSLDPSHVLLAIGLTHEIAHGSLRLTLGEANRMEDVETILEKLPPIVERLRAMSPLWDERPVK